MLILKGNKGPIYEIDFSPDGTKLVSAGNDGSARLWDLLEGKQIASRESTLVYSVAFSCDGRTVAIGGTKIQMWNTTRNVISEKLNIKGYWLSFGGVDFSANGQYLVAFGSCGLVCWQLKADRWQLSWNEPDWSSDMGCVACSPSQPTFASGSIMHIAKPQCNAVDIWSIKSGKHLGSIPERGPYSRFRTASLKYSPNGKMLAGACAGISLFGIRLLSKRFFVSRAAAPISNRLPSRRTTRSWPRSITTNQSAPGTRLPGKPESRMIGKSANCSTSPIPPTAFARRRAVTPGK